MVDEAKRRGRHSFKTKIIFIVCCSKHTCLSHLVTSWARRECARCFSHFIQLVSTTGIASTGIISNSDVYTYILIICVTLMNQILVSFISIILTRWRIIVPHIENLLLFTSQIRLALYLYLQINLDKKVAARSHNDSDSQSNTSERSACDKWPTRLVHSMTAMSHQRVWREDCFMII